MSTERGLAGVAPLTEYIEHLRRRLEFIEQRQAAGGYKPEAEDRARLDVAALRWALPVLEAERDHQVRLLRLIADAAHPNDRQPLERSIAAAERRRANRARSKAANR